MNIAAPVIPFYGLTPYIDILENATIIGKIDY